MGGYVPTYQVDMDTHKRRAADSKTPRPAGWPGGSVSLPPPLPPPCLLPMHSNLTQTNPVQPSCPRFTTPTLTCRLLGQSEGWELLFLSGPLQGWKHNAPPILTAYALTPMVSRLRR